MEWRHGPSPQAGDTRYRPPRAGDFLASDEASVRKAHRHLLGRLRAVEAEGYRSSHVVAADHQPVADGQRSAVSRPWPISWPRGDRLELKPTLRLTTAAVAMQRMEEEIGVRCSEYQGEWPDWWSFGTASRRGEVAASRIAKRLIEAAESPLWGPWTASGRRTVDELLRDLCLFDEHTWGSANSVALPDSLDTQGQFDEKAALAFRPMVRSEWLLGQRVRSRLVNQGEGLYVANSASLPWSGWVRMSTSALRKDDRSLQDAKSGGRTKMYFERGFRQFTPAKDPSELSRENPDATFADNAPRQIAKFWVEGLHGQSIRKLKLSTKDTSDDLRRRAPRPRSTWTPKAGPPASPGRR